MPGEYQVKLEKEVTILDAQAEVGARINTGFNVNNYRHIKVSVATDGGGDANFTLKFAGAISDGATANAGPDFTAAQSVTNMYDFLEVIDLEDGTAIDGDTGFAKVGADDYRIFTINVDGIKWFNARLTARSAGEVTVKMLAQSNQ